MPWQVESRACAACFEAPLLLLEWVGAGIPKLFPSWDIHVSLLSHHCFSISAGAFFPLSNLAGMSQIQKSQQGGRRKQWWWTDRQCDCISFTS